MSMKQTNREGDTADYQRERRHALIGKQVMDRLGQPQDLHGIQVRPLWEAYYRVNILVGADAASAKVAQSYFLRADGDGNILVTTPEIRRQY
jgi:hypothetical protein